MNILILEDEPLAVQKIRSVIDQNFNDINIVGIAQSNEEAKQLLLENRPDLMLCDIHLADGISFDFLNTINLNCDTIFITAYDQYALQSFEHNCIDYVLKPIDEVKLCKSLRKAQKRLIKEVPNILSNELIKVLLDRPQEKQYKKRFICKIGNKVVFKSIENISHFFVEDKLTFIQEAGTTKKYIINHTLDELDNRLLDPSRFYRINRSAIINLDHLLEMKKYNNGRLKLFTEVNITSDLIVARDRVSGFKEWINQ